MRESLIKRVKGLPFTQLASLLNLYYAAVRLTVLQSHHTYANVKLLLEIHRQNDYTILERNILCVTDNSDYVIGGMPFMDGYVRAETLAKKWDISLRRVQAFCKEGRIDGAIKFGTTWAIPKDAPKPTRTGKLKPGRKTIKVEQ